MHWQYVIPGYLVVFGGLGLYTLMMLRRARVLAQRVEPDSRRFLESES